MSQAERPGRPWAAGHTTGSVVASGTVSSVIASGTAGYVVASGTAGSTNTLRHPAAHARRRMSNYALWHAPARRRAPPEGGRPGRFLLAEIIENVKILIFLADIIMDSPLSSC